jgi:sodium-dependent dicarboxylate transporter 2/3/5
MAELPDTTGHSHYDKLLVAVALLAVVVLPFVLADSPVTARLLAVAGICLVLWLFELVPAFVPTLVLWALIPLTLFPLDPQYSLSNTLRWAADPVLALFFGGFALGVAAERHGISNKLAGWAVAWSGGSSVRMLALAMGMTAFMSMWISNIAAAALMFSALRPFLNRFEPDDLTRRTLLVGIAFAANIGGIGTPIGTGPNAIAIASVSKSVQLAFTDWMIFALPLTAGLLGSAFVLLYLRIRGKEDPRRPISAADLERDRDWFEGGSRSGRLVFLSTITICVALWLSEPLHGIPAAVVSIGAAALLFLGRSLKPGDLVRIDWSTLLLIAGGITLGRLLESSGLMQSVSTQFELGSLHPSLTIFVLCLASALLSALMSNTATVVMLIPLASALVPGPSTAVLMAISASFGMTFLISTPPNAMAHGKGVRSSDLFYPGLAIMLLGCILVSLTGRFILNFAGIP